MSTAAIAANHDLKRRVANYLRQQHQLELGAVEISAENGTVLLQGKLKSTYDKQLCLQACQRVAGVVRIVDELEVERQRSIVRRSA